MESQAALSRFRPYLVLAFFATLHFGCASNGPVQEVQEAHTSHYTPDAARLLVDVAWLADDAREGRRSASAGERASAEYIAARFEQLGLTPAGDEGYFQRFEVALPSRDGGGSFISVLSEGKDMRTDWKQGVGPVFCSEASKSGANGMVFAGYGIQDAERGWLDYGQIAEGEAKPVAGKCVLIVRGAPACDPPQLPEHATGWGANPGIFYKVMTAKRLGASAVVIAQHPRDAGKPLLALDPAQGARSGLAVVTITSELAEELLPGYAQAVSVMDADVESEGRHPLTSNGPRLSGAVQVFGDVVREKGLASNVLGLLKGGDGPTVVVGAHYDHLGLGGSGSLDTGGFGAIHNGADDNASGTAVVMEMARLLVDGEEPEGDVLFALWSGEEMGLLGSSHWCAEPTVPLDSVAANLNLDMVGRAGNGACLVMGAGTAAEFAGWMDGAGELAGLELDVSLSGQGLGGSDHQSFLNKQVPALHLFTGLHSDYHKPSDDTERFEADGAARVTVLALSLLESMQAADSLAYVAPKVDPNAPPERNRGNMRVRFGSVPVYSYDGDGMLISGTSPGSPAERGGLLGGDVIIKIGDIDIDSVRAFAYALKVYKPGDVVKTVYLRDGNEESVQVTLESRAAE